MVDPRFERSVRRWLWAYPRRWRWARADEIVGTLTDLAAPGATKLSRRDGLGLVVHGLAARRRMRPPLRVRLRYRLALGAVPWQYRGWVADDIASPWRGVWSVVFSFPLLYMVWTSRAGRSASDLFAAYAWFVPYVVTLVLMPQTRNRRETARSHLIPRPGDQPTPWDQKPGWIYRDRLPARDLLACLLWPLVTVVVVSATAVATSRTGWRGFAVCLGVGALAAARLAVRWRRWLPSRPDQPSRRGVPVGRRTMAFWWAVAAWCLAALLGADAFRPWGAPALLGAGLLVLPVVALGARLASRGPEDLAAVDVWRFVAGRGPLRADTLVAGVVPVWFGRETAIGLTEPPPAAPAPA